MHFFKIFCVFFLPILAMAVPAPDAFPDAKGRSALNFAKIASSLQARQETPDLSGGISDLLGSLGGIGDLLTPETFTEIDTILRNLAAVLDDEGTKKAKALVSNAYDLLTPEFVSQTKGLIADVAPVSLDLM